MALAADPDSNLVVNGGFEDGLKGWQTTGDVHLETNGPLDGKASVIIGPGAGSLAQRIETGSGNAFTVSATIQVAAHERVGFGRSASWTRKDER